MPDLKRQDGRQAQEVECDLDARGSWIDLDYMSNICTQVSDKISKNPNLKTYGESPQEPRAGS